MNNQEEAARIIAISDSRGSFVVGDDGYVVYWPDARDIGACNSWELRVIADELDRRNAAWDEQVQNDPRIGG
jgi:hypothetical protein